MSIGDFHCDMLQLSFSFALDDFDKDAFLQAGDVTDEEEFVDEDGDLMLAVSFPSREEPPSEHAHLTVMIRKDESDGQARVEFHKAGPKALDQKPPYLEESAQWLASFFKKEITTAEVTAAYLFGEEFSPTIPFPFPLVASSKGLAGLKVTGLSFQFPEDSRIEGGIIQRNDNETYVYLMTRPLVTLKEFSLNTILEELREPVNSLVKEKANGGNPQTTQA
jgi:hypothetical protein